MIQQEIRSQAFKALLALGAFFVLILVLGVLFGPWIERSTEQVFATLGLGGLILFAFVNDSFVSPIPPDVILVLISQSELRDRWVFPIFLIGLASTSAGGVGWWLGKKLQGTRLPKMLFGKKLQEGEEFARKYGALGVAIGALTPVPYSLTTWTAGMLRTPLRAVLLASLLRIPRFFLYYLVLTGALNFGEVLRGFFDSW